MLDPIISITVEAKDKADDGKLLRLLQKHAQKDPLLKVRTGSTDSQTVLAGMSETQLEKVLHSITNKNDIELIVGKPKIEYRETVTKQVKQEGKFIRWSQGGGAYGHVELVLSPNDATPRVKIENKIVSGLIPAKFIKAIEEGIRERLEIGSSRGWPVIDVTATIVFGSYHETDSSSSAFRTAASYAVKEALAKAELVLLEPIMELDINAPASMRETIKNEISIRRGTIVANGKAIHATAPLSELLGYAADLEGRSEGKCKVNISFLRYAPAPSAN